VDQGRHRKAPRTKKAAGLGKVPLDIRVGWLIEHGHRPAWIDTVEQSHGGRRGKWPIGTFWAKIRPNWTGGKCTRLPPDQKARLNAVEWVKAEFQ
jgi:hypothetical protein